MTASYIRRAVLVCGVTLATGACGSRDRANGAIDTASAGGEVAATTPAPAMPESAAGASAAGARAAGASAAGASAAGVAGAMSAANAMSVVGAANANEIATGELAQERATHAEVRSFADDMVEDHRAMQREADALAQRLDITPRPAARSEEMRRLGNEMAQRLQDTPTGAAFDRAYLEGQVQVHQATLDELTALESAVSDEQVRTLVNDAIPRVRAHLERAQRVQEQLGG